MLTALENLSEAGVLGAGLVVSMGANAWLLKALLAEMRTGRDSDREILKELFQATSVLDRAIDVMRGGGK